MYRVGKESDAVDYLHFFLLLIALGLVLQFLFSQNMTA